RGAMGGMAGMATGHGHGRERDSAAAARQGGGQPMAAMHMPAGPLGVPMTRQGSGTSWLPDAAPMHAQHLSEGEWQLMIHGVEFVQYDRQIGGARGDDQVGAIGWLMGMAAHPVGAGRVTFRAMVSADPWTVGERGYPLIGQSGEAFDGAPLHDR